MDAKGSGQHPKREETRPSPRKFGRSTSGASHLRPATRSKRTGRSRRTLYASRASPSPRVATLNQSTSGASHLRPATRTRRTGRSRRTLYASCASLARRNHPKDLLTQCQKITRLADLWLWHPYLGSTTGQCTLAVCCQLGLCRPSLGHRGECSPSRCSR